jgi:hypothetical protein
MCVNRGEDEEVGEEQPLHASRAAPRAVAARIVFMGVLEFKCGRG